MKTLNTGLRCISGGVNVDGSSVSFHRLELHPCNVAPSGPGGTETITHLHHGMGLLLSKELNHSLSAGCPWVCVCLLWR